MARNKSNTAKKETFEEPTYEQEENVEQTESETVEPGQEKGDIDPNWESIKSSFINATNSGGDEDAIKMAMIQAGAKFKNVARYYNILLVEFGFAKSKEEKTDILNEVLTGRDLSQELVFNEVVQVIAERVEVSEKAAAVMVRQWAKKNEIDYFKKPKAEPGERESIAGKIYDWLFDNSQKPIEEFFAFLDSFNSENISKRRAKYTNLYNFVNRIVTKYNS